MDEFSGMGHFICLMLSKDTNKATIIEHTGGEVVSESKTCLQFSRMITDSIIKYGWQQVKRERGPLKVIPISGSGLDQSKQQKKTHVKKHLVSFLSQYISWTKV